MPLYFNYHKLDIEYDVCNMCVCVCDVCSVCVWYVCSVCMMKWCNAVIIPYTVVELINITTIKYILSIKKMIIDKSKNEAYTID